MFMFPLKNLARKGLKEHYSFQGGSVWLEVAEFAFQRKDKPKTSPSTHYSPYRKTAFDIFQTAH